MDFDPYLITLGFSHFGRSFDYLYLLSKNDSTLSASTKFY